MKTIAPRNRRAAWLAFAAPALLTTPAFAQDATTAAPPPVRATLPQAAPPAAAPPAARTQTPPPSTESGRPVASTAVNPQSRTTLSPEAQAALDEARAAREARPARAAPARPARIASTQRTTVTRTAAPAAVAAAPIAAPVAETPAPVAAVPPAPVETVAPPPVSDVTTQPTGADTTTETTTEERGAPIWPMFALAAVALAGILGFLAWRRRRERQDEEEYFYEEQPVAVATEPEPYFAPVPVTPAVAAAAAAPAVERVGPVDEPVIEAAPAAVAAEDATVADAEEADVAALTDAAPVANRPWLEFAMRPVRAGTSADEALVEIELTVANAGTTAAEDVRVSAFMLTDPHASEMERMLVDPPADAAVAPLTIAPGEGTRIDATLAALKADLGEEGSFTPVVVADARYRLPGGGEGRTSATFLVGVADDGTAELRPLDLADRVMREDIGARLHGEPQHA